VAGVPFSDPTPLLFQDFLIRVRTFFKFENPTPVQTPAAIDPTEIHKRFYLRNNMYKGHADSCYCRKQKVTPDPGPVFYKFLTPAPSPKEKRKIQLELTPAIWIRGHLWSVRPGSKKHLYD